MDGSIILRRLIALMRSCVIQAAPTRNLDGGYQRIGRYGRTNGPTFDLPRLTLGGRIIEVLGQRGGNFSSRARHFLQIYLDGCQMTVSALPQTRSILTLI